MDNVDLLVFYDILILISMNKSKCQYCNSSSVFYKLGDGKALRPLWMGLTRDGSGRYLFLLSRLLPVM